MPQIPRLTGSSVEIVGIATPRAQGASADAHGGQVGTALTGMSTQVIAALKQETDEQDASRINKAQADYEGWKNKYLNDDKEGLFTVIGEDAINPKNGRTLEDQGTEAHKKYVSEAAANLSTTRQKDLFQRYVEKDAPSFILSINKHEREQGQVVKMGNAKSATETLFNNVGGIAASNNFDSREFNSQVEKLMNKVNIQASFEGFGVDSEYSKNLRAKYLSAAHEARVDHLAITDPLAARNYLDGVIDKVNPKAAEARYKMLKPLETKQAGMSTALELSAPFSDANDPVELDNYVGAALEQARTRLKNNPDALNIAEVQINQMAGARERSINIARAGAVKPINRTMVEVRATGRIPSLSDFKDSDWAALVRTDPDKADDILRSIQNESRMAEDRRQSKIDRAESKRDRQEMRQERETLRAERQKIESIQETNFSSLWGNPRALAEADIDSMVAMGTLTPLDGGKLEARRKSYDPDHILAEAADVNKVMKAAKIQPGSDQEREIKRYVADRITLSKEKPTSAQVTEFAREALYDVDVTVWDRRNKPAYKMTIADVPKKEQSAIKEGLRMAGRAVTEGNIVAGSVEMQRKERR